MKKDPRKVDAAANPHVGCYGGYDAVDVICRRFCSLRLRCAIESRRSARLELIEDLISCEEMPFKLQ